MGESLRLVHSSSKKIEPKIITSKKHQSNSGLDEGFSLKSIKCISSMSQGLLGNGPAMDIGLFLVKTAALETVRRFSTAKCPIIWQGIQALQILSYPPFKWLQKWAPFKAFFTCIQSLSRPLLVLSIATLFSDQSSSPAKRIDSSRNSPSYSGRQQGLSSELSNSETRAYDEASASSVASEKWFQDLQRELENEGITIPDRLNEDELYRFYAAANGDPSRLLSSIKKTILWRQSYTFLSLEELAAWSQLVFWHGYDVQQRPCLIIRLGLACSRLTSNQKSLFVKAVVSQIELGVKDLLEADNPQVTVLMDCGGLPPFGFPMHMMRSCAVLLQDHYPNRLGYLIVVRLPRVARMITQTLFQVLRPATQKKLRIIGQDYQKGLSEYLKTLPSFLGGECPCAHCCEDDDESGADKESILVRPIESLVNEITSSPTARLTETAVSLNSNIIIKVVVGILVVWILTAILLARHYPDSLFGGGI